MPTGSFEKTNWSWQLQQFQQQVGEWVELQFSRFISAFPEGSIPDWSMDNVSWLWHLLEAVVWLVLGLLLTWLGWQLWQKISPSLHSLISEAGSTGNKATAVVSQLTGQEWLQRSQECFSKGDYRSACRYLYLAMLQRLNDTGIAPHQSSRTDGEYRQLVEQLPQPQPYQTLIATHEQLCFGNAEIMSETFEQCQQAYREIESQ